MRVCVSGGGVTASLHWVSHQEREKNVSKQQGNMKGSEQTASVEEKKDGREMLCGFVFFVCFFEEGKGCWKWVETREI